MGRLVCLAAVLVGCTGKDSSAPDSSSSPDDTNSVQQGVVLPYDSWNYVPPDADGLYDHPVDAEPCPSVGYEAENGFFEIETDYCAIATFTQTLASEVPAGASIRFVVWNLDLWAPEPYDAVRLLRLGETDIWTDTVAVPGDEGVNELVIEAPVDFPAGTPAWFHLRNHGVNSWRIGDVERVP